MDRITMPSALLSCLLLIQVGRSETGERLLCRSRQASARGQEPRQKRVVIGHRGRSANQYMRRVLALLLLTTVSLTIAADDFLGSRVSPFKESTYDFRLSRSAIDKAPDWMADSDFPPLPPGKAYEIALRQAKQLRPEVRIWGTKNLLLQPVLGKSNLFQDQDWIYLVTLQDVSGPIAGVPWSLAIPIYMDGSTVKPMITRSKK